MVDMRITPDDLTDPAVVALLEEHVSELRSMSPPESTHALDLAGLQAADVTVWVAREGDLVLGCGALKQLTPGHGEIKSMRTAGAAQRRGVARLVLAEILDEARRRGMTRLSLETGSDAFFAPAHALYEAHGFTECPPFGSYRPDPLSTFLTLDLHDS
jgi:putative acetyltransferase